MALGLDAIEAAATANFPSLQVQVGDKIVDVKVCCDAKQLAAIKKAYPGGVIPGDASKMTMTDFPDVQKKWLEQKAKELAAKG